MLTSQESDFIQNRKRISYVLWFAFFNSAILFIVLSHVMNQKSNQTTSFSVNLQNTFLAVAMVFTLLSIFISLYGKKKFVFDKLSTSLQEESHLQNTALSMTPIEKSLIKNIPPETQTPLFFYSNKVISLELSASLISFALNEISMVAGFLFSIQTHRFEAIFPFVGLFVLGHILAFPRLESFLNEAQKQIQSHEMTKQ